MICEMRKDCGAGACACASACTAESLSWWGEICAVRSGRHSRKVEGVREQSRRCDCTEVGSARQRNRRHSVAGKVAMAL